MLTTSRSAPQSGHWVISFCMTFFNSISLKHSGHSAVPVTVFKDADKLEHLDGQAFLRTTESGEARVVEAGEDGAGLLSTRAVERSNVDIATEFSKLILAQRAYSANSKIVTTVDELLQETLNMRR